MSEKILNKIIVISGATASAKSELAVRIAAKINSVIINADALQIYQELPILSAQPSENDKKKYQHFLYGYLAHNQSSNIADWLNLVEENIKKNSSENKLPIVVGGSGMYISKLIEGINQIPQISLENKKIAQDLFAEIGCEKMQELLIKLGEKKILDKQRIIRAYEVFLETNKTLSWWHQQEKKKIFPTNSFIHLNINLDREILYQNCNNRFTAMIKKGAVEEVTELMKKNTSPDSQICKTLGFVEITDYLQNKIDKKTMIEIASQKTRNYAKRQLTWFRNQFIEKNIFTNIDEAEKFIDKILL